MRKQRFRNTGRRNNAGQHNNCRVFGASSHSQNDAAENSGQRFRNQHIPDILEFCRA